MSMLTQSIVGVCIRNFETRQPEELHSVEILWTIDRPDAEFSTYATHNTKNSRTHM
jgi:hypothetical protein